MQQIGLFERYKFTPGGDITVPDVCPARATTRQLGGNVCRWLFERSGYDRTPYRLDENNGTIYMGNEIALRIDAVCGSHWEVYQAPNLQLFAPLLAVKLQYGDRIITPDQLVYDNKALHAGACAWPGFVPVVWAEMSVHGLQAACFLGGSERGRLLPGYSEMTCSPYSRDLRSGLDMAPACVLNAFEPGEDPHADLVLAEVEQRAIRTITGEK